MPNKYLISRNYSRNKCDNGFTIFGNGLQHMFEKFMARLLTRFTLYKKAANWHKYQFFASLSKRFSFITWIVTKNIQGVCRIGKKSIIFKKVVFLSLIHSLVIIATTQKKIRIKIGYTTWIWCYSQFYLLSNLYKILSHFKNLPHFFLHCSKNADFFRTWRHSTVLFCIAVYYMPLLIY